MGVRIGGTHGDIDPLNKVPLLREPEGGFRRVPFKRSPYYYLGEELRGTKTLNARPSRPKSLEGCVSLAPCGGSDFFWCRAEDFRIRALRLVQESLGVLRALLKNIHVIQVPK